MNGFVYFLRKWFAEAKTQHKFVLQGFVLI